MNTLETILHLVAITSLSIVLSLFALLSVRLAGVDIKDIKQRTSPRVLAIAMLFNLLFIVSVALIMKYWDHQSISVLGFSIGVKGLLYVIFVLLFSVTFAIFYVRILNVRKIIQIGVLSTKKGISKFKSTTLFGFLVLLVAALQEEILFRGYFSYVLLPYGFWYGLFISSMVFTLWHFLTNKAGLFQTTDWFMGGIMLFYIYWVSGSIWIAAMTHFGRNITNVLVFDISGSNSLVQYEKPIPPSYKSVYTILLSILIMLSGYFVFS